MVDIHVVYALYCFGCKGLAIKINGSGKVRDSSSIRARAGTGALSSFTGVIDIYATFKYCTRYLHTVHKNMTAWDCFIGLRGH